MIWLVRVICMFVRSFFFSSSKSLLLRFKLHCFLSRFSVQFFYHFFADETLPSFVFFFFLRSTFEQMKRSGWFSVYFVSFSIRIALYFDKVTDICMQILFFLLSTNKQTINWKVWEWIVQVNCVSFCVIFLVECDVKQALGFRLNFGLSRMKIRQLKIPPSRD